jgi:hypothetical protein
MTAFKITGNLEADLAAAGCTPETIAAVLRQRDLDRVLDRRTSDGRTVREHVDTIGRGTGEVSA